MANNGTLLGPVGTSRLLEIYAQDDYRGVDQRIGTDIVDFSTISGPSPPQGGEGHEGLGAAGSCEDDSPYRNRRPRGAQRFGDMHSNRNGRLFDDFELRLA